jgi:hypothetical protein
MAKKSAPPPAAAAAVYFWTAQWQVFFPVPHWLVAVFFIIVSMSAAAASDRSRFWLRFNDGPTRFFVLFCIRRKDLTNYRSSLHTMSGPSGMNAVLASILATEKKDKRKTFRRVCAIAVTSSA